MEKGGIIMKIEKKWSANPKLDQFKKDQELVNIAGQWGVGIKVRINNPYRFSHGPIEEKAITKKT
jgi:hypothetical protein